MFKKKQLPLYLRFLLSSVVLFIWGMAFSGVVPFAAWLFGKLPLVPALLALSLPLIVILFLTLIAGRFYCSCCCPLGIIQDILRWVLRRKNPIRRDLFKIRLVITGFCLGSAAAGYAGGFMLFDPYSLSGRATMPLTIAGGAIIFALILMMLYQERIFCTALCPAGTILGSFSVLPVFRLSLRSNCVKCRRCVSVCPAGCIDTERKKVDNSRCLRCLKCMAVCPLPESGINFRLVCRQDVADISRRSLLINGGIILAAASAGIAAGKVPLIGKTAAKNPSPLLPPGAGNLQRFTNKCTSCLLCVKNCPAKIIRPPEFPHSYVTLDVTTSSCRYECNLCGQICPSQAIIKQPLALKQKTRIAMAHINQLACIGCGKCITACPAGALTGRKQLPRLNSGKCIGCGACAAVCPATAITLEAVDQQIILPN